MPTRPGSRLTFSRSLLERRSAALGTTAPAGDGRRLFDPDLQLFLVERIVLVDVEVAHFPVFGLAGGDGTQRRAAEEGHLDVLREAMVAQEPALAFDSVEGRVPSNGLSHAGHGVPDERVEPAADVPFPARHGRDVGPHGGVTPGLRDLRVAPGEKGRLPAPRLGFGGGGFPIGAARPSLGRFGTWHRFSNTCRPAEECQGLGVCGRRAPRSENYCLWS